MAKGKGKKKGKATPSTSAETTTPSTSEETTTPSTSLETATSALTLEEGQASTSAAQIAPPAEGPTGGKKDTKDAPETKAKAEPPKPATKEPEEEDGGLGLTGPAKARRPRKKKVSLAVLEAQAAKDAQQQPTAVPPVALPPKVVEAAPPVQYPPQPQQTQWGPSQPVQPRSQPFPQQSRPQHPQQYPPQQYPPQMGQPQHPQQYPPQQYPPQMGQPQPPQQYPPQQYPPQMGQPQYPPGMAQPQHPQQPPQLRAPFPQQGAPQYHPQPGPPGQPQPRPWSGQGDTPHRPPGPRGRGGPPAASAPADTPHRPPGPRGRGGPPAASAPAGRWSTKSSVGLKSLPPPVQPGPSYIHTIPATQPQAAASDKNAPLPKSRQEIVCRYTIPAKVLGGTVPYNKIKVITNYLKMDIDAKIVHRYDFLFTPDKPKKVIPHVYKILKDRLFPREYIAFDMYKNGYCLNLLDKTIVEDVSKKESRRDHKVEFVDQNGKVMAFTVSLKYTGCVDFGKIIRHMEHHGSSLALPQEEVQCMDVILRQGTLQDYVKCGRNFFKRPERPTNLGHGLETWTGLFQSAVFTNRGYINIDVAHKGFPIHQSILEALPAFQLDPNRPIEQQGGFFLERFKDFVKNLRVTCQMMGGQSDGQTREFIVNAVKENPKQLYFEKEDGSKMSVYDYFLKEKRYKIKYPHLPCLWVGVRNKSIYYPLELCVVTYGQAIRKQLNETQLATMVREAATPPNERLRKIEEVAASMNYSNNTYFKHFGLKISNSFLRVDAKVLQPPSLNCGEQRLTLPGRGQWNSSKLMKAEALTSWGFIGLDLPPTACNFDYTKSLILQTARSMGMQVNEPITVAFNVPIKDLRSVLYKAANDQKIRLMFVVVPVRGRDHYHRVKQQAEIDVGILTQCIRDVTAARRMNPQVIKNILLKVNSKLMGINQCLDSRSTPSCIQAGGVMIVGADVTHPSPEQQNIPSIAAVTASIDPKCYLYNIELSIQSPKEEVIKEFSEIMTDHFKVYMQNNNGKIPKKIYVFRDGVSDGQFGQIMNSELTGLLTAYARFSKEKPEVLFLLVQKRHHTRLFGQDRNNRVVNVEPGTIVDTDIVHPRELNFFLVSHAAIKGTARPTRYHSVCNDGNIPQDEVEQLTFYLCHLYSRCMRSVSYPTPTYYAHLACLRARSLTYGQSFDNKVLETKPQRLRVMEKMLRSSRMFFV